MSHLNNTELSIKSSETYKKIIEKETQLNEIKKSLNVLYQNLLTEHLNKIKQIYGINENIKLKCNELFDGYDDNEDHIRRIIIINETDNKIIVNYEYKVYTNEFDYKESIYGINNQKSKDDLLDELEMLIPWHIIEKY